ncbi:lamin tail domain-containing protein 2 isoform X1 [Physeter macrocephalus]|uniref:Lamin tail domain-containing protein 2 isoform X1 n=1 Tax=Physeter macrocephalus TaxID=9755 RepID=A0A9W2WJ17_PHYMC|nr:lamin tail domain-containing protein 2 isoform X1 [Physeter catodon]XP_054939151.1 lamin tail domain-containing protein 2 isoform X1 [Physeter catodon]XP_054939152.1 lamin tail domain-containing protein 2 isoform X1 [Physeter catodon]
MAPESCQEAEDAEEEAFPSLVDRELVSGHVGPPASASADAGAPACPQDTKPSSTRMVSSVNPQSAPESLDPRILRLLWRQRELEIQALRWAIENHREARHCRILQEVAGLPAERSSHSRKLLQNQVRKLTLELEEQKEQAQLEKAHLEERLLQTGDTLRQLEAELQALQKSCLLQLARSSWVGRMLRSSVGSVEVVMAETLMDPSDLSENDRSPTAGEGFQLEDVDWNSIAHRYPNLFTNLESSSDQKLPRAPPLPELPPATQPERRNSGLCCRQRRHRLKSVEWRCPPLGGSSSSRGADSEASGCLLTARYLVLKVTGDPPQAPGHTAEQTEAQAQNLCGDSRATSEGRPSLDLRKTHSDRHGKNGQEPESSADPHPRHSGRCPSPTGSCLKITAVSRRRRFVRILNQSLEETADLGGFVLQQLVRDFPVCMYRFPPSTLLEPRHHITVWGEAPGSTKRQPPSSLGQEPVHLHSSRGCVTLLLNPQGEVLSEHQAAHCVTLVCRIFADNTDLSIDRFPLSEARPGADLAEQQPLPRPPRKGRVQEARAGRRRPGTRVQLPRLSTRKLQRQREEPARPEGAAETLPELLPASRIPIPEAGLRVEDCQARKEHKLRVRRKSVDRGCPMVALSVQSTAESRFGFRFLSCPPITADSRWQV